MNYVYGLVDMQSFYASCEMASRPEYKDRRLEDDRTDPVLIVAGDPERRHGIVLACSQSAKRLGVSNAMRLGEALVHAPDARVVKPRMQFYLDTSLQIQKVLRAMFPLQEQFSIDESFFAFPYPSLLFDNPIDIAQRIRERIWDQFRIRCRIGMGPNKWIAKMTNAIAKKKSDGIEWWKQDEVIAKLHPLSVFEMWGLKRRAEHLYIRFGCQTIGDVANIPVANLRKAFGVWGEVIHRWSHGQDLSRIEPDTYDGELKGCSHRMTLPRDYESREAVATVILELADEVCRRVRSKKQKGRRIGLSITYQGLTGGFHKAKTIQLLTDQTKDIVPILLAILDKHWDLTPVRAVGVSLDILQVSDSIQLSLFDDEVKKHNLSRTVDQIQASFGETSIFRASSLSPHGQIHDRSKKIGGHYL
ncbi:DNA polymerase IV [Fodinisporobacter ferrooxydans]|uniref:DNA polymerase IV n=1 Tax=Fodinisporobacter ferrooxydans TaxID=2901836 RepID=A0ABY4CGM1_9BACL|nr:DNA polymerase IV [Alicyclobacillaceae bacterium MYW30-H2]